MLTPTKNATHNSLWLRRLSSSHLLCDSFLSSSHLLCDSFLSSSSFREERLSLAGDVALSRAAVQKVRRMKFSLSSALINLSSFVTSDIFWRIHTDFFLQKEYVDSPKNEIKRTICKLPVYTYMCTK